MAVPTIRSEISVRELQEQELSAAIGSSVVFGTSLGIPDPLQFSGNADYVHTTWRAHPEGSFAAECGGELAGSNVAGRWVAWRFSGRLPFGRISGNRGIGKHLLQPMCHCGPGTEVSLMRENGPKQPVEWAA
jgi:hypothetical protein